MLEIIAFVVALLSLAPSLETFGKVGFFWKLFVIPFSAIIVLYLVAHYLSKWVNPKPPTGFVKDTYSRSKKRVALSGGALAAICASYTFIAWLIVHFYTVGVVENVMPHGKLEFWIQGAIQITDKVSIQLPPPGQVSCEPIDPPEGGRHRAEATMVDWNSLNPQLQISNFSSPQRLGVRCTPRIDISRITVRVEPPTIQVLFSDRRSCYKYIIFVTGGILWIAAFVFFLVRSR
jgi:hypothetical protein